MNLDEDLTPKNLTISDIHSYLPDRPSLGRLGFSQIGEPDERLLWLDYRWCLPREASPTMQMLFGLGNRIEEEVLSGLTRIPHLEVVTKTRQGKQVRFDQFGGHFSGSMDGAGKGFREAPLTWHVIEIKSANAKSFAALLKCGSVEKWNLKYFVQAQMYMGAAGLTRCMFIVYNKDTSELYQERLYYQPDLYAQMCEKAERIISSFMPPSPSGKAKNSHPVYAGSHLPAPNCRNCRHSKPAYTGDAVWQCHLWTPTVVDIPADVQRKGCKRHNYMPMLMPASARYAGESGDSVDYSIGDTVFWNTPEDSAIVQAGCYSSKELHCMSVSGLGICEEVLNDSERDTLRTRFGARIVREDVFLDDDDIPF